MYSKLNLLIVCLVVFALSRTVDAQCTPLNLLPNVDIARLEENALVIDVRPDQINQFKGKSSFKNQARIALVHMNPFLFSYSLKVDQTEIQDTGFLNFLNLLGSPVSDLIGSVSASSRSAEVRTTTGGSLLELITRTTAPPPGPHSSCPANQTVDAGQAIATLTYMRNLVVSTANVGGGGGLDANVAATATQFVPARNAFVAQKDIIFDSSVEAAPLCTSANTLNTNLTAAGYPTVTVIQTLLVDIRDFQSLVDELKSTAQEYKNEYEDCPARMPNGLSYADNLIRLADEFSKVGKAYETKATAMLNETKGYDALRSTIARLSNQMLQKEYTVESQYDITALDITATAVPLGETPASRTKDIVEQRVVGDIRSAQASAASAQASARVVSVGTIESAEGVRVFAPRGAQATFRAQATSGDGDSESKGGGDGGNSETGAKQIKATGIIGARRFQISGGMAFSSLGRREFQPVLGFPRNAEGEIIDPETGNPTTDRKLTNIVGLSEESSRRFAPIGMLHYRIPYTQNIFASVGFTGKRDEYGVDLEYLFGPSFLYKNLFLTFGAYAGKQQRLAGDLFEGAAIEGDTIPVRKGYKWGFGFGLTFKIPLGDKKTNE